MAKYEEKTAGGGTENPKYVDLLGEDKAISGQKFCCLSFLSPEKILKDKKLFLFEKFLKHFETDESVKKFSQFLNFLSYKYELDFAKIMEDFEDFFKSEKDKLSNSTILDKYKNFLDQKEDELQKEFDILNEFKTNIRGIKIRGSFQTQEEAQLRCRMLREIDPDHDIYVGQVGMWMPFDPDAYRTGNVEYMENELNHLMHEKNKSEEIAKRTFDKRVKDSKRKAIEENIKIAKESGNKLTQTLNEEGDLIGVGTNTRLNKLKNEEVSSADIRKELFEGDEIRTKAFDRKNQDRRYKEVIERDGEFEKPPQSKPKNVILEVNEEDDDE